MCGEKHRNQVIMVWGFVRTISRFKEVDKREKRREGRCSNRKLLIVIYV